MKSISKLFLVLFLLSAACFALAEDFSFVHISDLHSGAGGGTKDSIRDAGNISSILLEPYGVTAPPPSFLIDTGDVTEFGTFEGMYRNAMELFAEGILTRYPTLGNHDGTWRWLGPEIIRDFGATYYSFNKHNCHFIVLDSAGLQDPAPLFEPEQLNWLKTDLKKAGEKTPIFIAFHHPLGGGEFSSPYQMYQLLDILRSYNVVLLMVGHGHQAVHFKYEGYDMVEGGSGYGPGTPGYNIVTLKDNRLMVAHKHTSQKAATLPLLEKEVFWKETAYPEISIVSPKELKDYSGKLKLKAKVDKNERNITSCEAEIDNSLRITLDSISNNSYEGTADLSELIVGAHYIRFIFKNDSGETFHKSTAFYVKNDKTKMLWKRNIGSAVKSAPLAHDGNIYVATFDGRVLAVNAGSGKVRWEKNIGYAINGDLAAVGNKIFVGCTDSNLYCLDSRTGEDIWIFTTKTDDEKEEPTFIAGNPIFSSIVTDDQNVYFGTSTGAFYSLVADTGRLRWINTSAQYNIESRPFIDGDRIYFGAWDCYVYCLSAISGEFIWKCMGQGSAEGIAPRYYSPADCGPVKCGNNIFAADRKYRLSIIDAVGGNQSKFLNGISAVGTSADGESVYFRYNNGDLAKADKNGETLWSVQSNCDSAPVAPVEHNGMVYVCSKKGTFSSHSAIDGKKMQEYKLTPGLFALAGICPADRAVVMCGTDGVLTAVEYIK